MNQISLNRFESFVPKNIENRSVEKQRIRDEHAKEMQEITDNLKIKISKLSNVKSVDLFEKNFIDMFKDTTVELGNKYSRVIRFKKPKGWKKSFYYKGVDFGPAEWCARYNHIENEIDVPKSLLVDSNLNDLERLEGLFKKHFDLDIKVRLITDYEYRDA